MKIYIYVTGGKGGIGKSMETLAIVDFYAEQGIEVLLLDADPTNGDSSASYKVKKEKDEVTVAANKQENVSTERVMVRSEDASGQIDASGLMDTLNKANESKAQVTIVDAPAGDSTLLRDAGSIIVAACNEMKTKSVIVWMVNSNDRTAINALSKSWESIKGADTILIVKNHKDGSDFQCFLESKAMVDILSSKNIKMIDMPKVAARLVKLVREDRKTFKELATTTSIGDKVEAIRMRKVFADSLKGAGL